MKSKFFHLVSLLSERGYGVDYDDSQFDSYRVLIVFVSCGNDFHMDCKFNSWRDAYYYLLGVFHMTYQY